MTGASAVLTAEVVSAFFEDEAEAEVCKAAVEADGAVFSVRGGSVFASG